MKLLVGTTFITFTSKQLNNYNYSQSINFFYQNNYFNMRLKKYSVLYLVLLTILFVYPSCSKDTPQIPQEEVIEEEVIEQEVFEQVVTLNHIEATLEIDDKVILIPKFGDVDIPKRTYSWQVENPTIINISENEDYSATITAIKKGKTLIAFKSEDGRLSAECKITVTDTGNIVVKQILDVDWKLDKLSDNIVYKYHHFNDLFNSNQSVSVLDIDINKNLVVDIAYVTSSFLKTSDAGINADATAAINGSYFNTTIGGSTVFLKKDGKVINSTRMGFDTYRENAGFAIHKSGEISIIKKPAGKWDFTAVNTVLASGPLLIYDGILLDQINVAFNMNRHPRTAVGVTDKNHLIAVVVDGRHSQAHGMTIEELSILMDAFGCKEAMNLDGGGSSTLWLRNRGVINYPTDNKKFDHEGERGVATVITFTSK